MSYDKHCKPADVIAQFWKLVDALDVGTPGDFRGRLHTMRASAMVLDRVNLTECNGVIGPDGYAKWDDADQAKADRSRERHQERIRREVSFLFDAETFKRIRIDFSGDPRGPAVRIGLVGSTADLMTLW